MFNIDKEIFDYIMIYKMHSVNLFKIAKELIL